MTAPTTPASPVQVYVLAEGTKFGIPLSLEAAGIATKQEVVLAANAANTRLAAGQNTTLEGTGSAEDPVVVNTPTVTLGLVGGSYVLTNQEGTKVTIDPSVFVAATSPTGLKAAPDGSLYVPGANELSPWIVVVAVAGNYPSASDEKTTTPAYVSAALDDHANLANGTNTTVTGTGSLANPRKVNVATATDTVPGVSPLAVAANYPSTSDTDSTTPAYVAAAIDAIPDDPVSTMAVVGVNYVHTDELGEATVIQPGQFIANVAGNALATAADGRLVIQIPAQLPDDQVLSGDNTGTVNLVLTPITVNAGTPDEQVNYTIKADLKVAALNPDGSANRLKWGPSGFYVEVKDVFCE
jgi:hypothetical protein